MKKITLKNILLFLLFVFIYFLPSILFKMDFSFYNEVKRPNVPQIIFPIAWTIIYITLSIFITYLINNHPFKDNKRIYIYLIINYFIQAAFIFAFFGANDLFWSYIITIATFASSIFIFLEAYPLNKKVSFLLTPYLIWGAFATILSIIIYLWN